MAKEIPIGLVGFGTVGQGVSAILQTNGKIISKKLGAKLVLKHIIEKYPDRTFDVPVDRNIITDDLNTLLRDPTVKIAIELVGGTTVAREIVEKLLMAGKHVVTANKALLAHHGKELFELARKYDRCIAFEASCGGGIPLVESIRRGLAANKINAIYGILNGTCNYILTSMSREGKSYSQALKEAQEKGFAEADPSLDVNGTDAAHKLTILSSLAFGAFVPFDAVYCEGIDNLELIDIEYGKELGYEIKLLAIGLLEEDGISVRVHPAFVNEDNPLAHVAGVFNAVSVYGNAVGHTMFYGRGAGRMPTASAVVADVMDIILGNAVQTFHKLSILPDITLPAPIKPIEQITSRYYLRLMVVDRPGVLAKFASILGKHDISVSAVIQHEVTKPRLNEDKEPIVPVIVLTHQAKEGNIKQAIEKITNLDISAQKPVCIRVVDQHPEFE